LRLIETLSEDLRMAEAEVTALQDEINARKALSEELTSVEERVLTYFEGGHFHRSRPRNYPPRWHAGVAEFVLPGWLDAARDRATALRTQLNAAREVVD
jgi:hypothetical protein